MDTRAVAAIFDLSDKHFFQQHSDRLAHIRLPHQDECAVEFADLGEHNRTRRRILLCRADSEGRVISDGRILKIPFLLFADETVEDRDDVLLPIARQIMEIGLVTFGQSAGMQ